MTQNSNLFYFFFSRDTILSKKNVCDNMRVVDIDCHHSVVVLGLVFQMHGHFYELMGRIPPWRTMRRYETKIYVVLGGEKKFLLSIFHRLAGLLYIKLWVYVLSCVCFIFLLLKKEVWGEFFYGLSIIFRILLVNMLMRITNCYRVFGAEI